jgi:hypothetical protein
MCPAKSIVLVLLLCANHFLFAQDEMPSLDVLGANTSFPYGKLNAEAPEETSQWGQLAGVWQCVSKDIATREEGERTWFTNKAIWKWEYVLGGHAVLNQWWQEDNNPKAATSEFFATGLFIFNPKTNLWEAVVAHSRPHQLSPKFQASFQDGKIMMHDGTGEWLVTFYDIKPNSFEWRYDIPDSKGGWRPISFISAKRYQ